jgi:uncharacterized protein
LDPTSPDAPAPDAPATLPVALPPPPFRKSGSAFFAALLALFLPGLLAQSLHPAAGLAWSELFVFALPAVLAALGSNLRPVAYLGLTRPGRAPAVLGVLVGGAGFLVANALMALWIRVVPRAWVELFDIGKLFETPIGVRVAIALVASVLAPLCEELAFRGYVQRTYAIRHGHRLAIPAAALLFAALHVDPVRFPALVFLGVVYGWLAARAGSIWPAIAAHAVNNGLASAIALLAARPEAPVEAPPVADVLRALVVGGLALALLLRAYRNATPAPPPPASAIVLRDPADPRTRFDLRRVPGSAWSAAVAGAVLLVAIGLLGGRRALEPERVNPRPPPAAERPGSAP